MCNYWHGGTIECRGDGFMWDADDDGYDPDDKSWPCPACNTKEWLESGKENGESISSSSGYWGTTTGEDMWRSAVSTALKENPLHAPKLIRSMGIVRPIIDDENNPASFVELVFDNRQQRHVVSRNRREGKYLVKRIPND